MLYKATTLTFTGLAVALGLRAGLFNIGAESQLAAGGFCRGAGRTACCRRGCPRWSTLPVYLLAAALGGGVVGGVPGVLKAKFGAHEVITTIMLNFIVLALLNYLIDRASQGRRTRCTRRRSTPARCRGSRDFVAAFHGSAANVVIVPRASLAAIVVVVVSLPHAPRLRAARDGLQPQAAEYGGVDVGGVWWRAMALSGALAGIGGLNFVLGYKHYYEEAFASGAGFLGIAVAHRRTKPSARRRARRAACSRRSRRAGSR